MTRSVALLLSLVAAPGFANVQKWSSLYFRIASEAQLVQTREAASLRRNFDAVNTVICGTDHARWKNTVEPQLVEMPDAEKKCGLEMINLLMKDRCPSN